MRTRRQLSGCVSIAVVLALIAACASGDSDVATVDGTEPAVGPSDQPSATDTAAATGPDLTSSTGEPPATDTPAPTGTDTTVSPTTEPTTDPTASGTTPDPTTIVPELEDRTCPGEPFPEIDCHWVTVPADWSTPAADTIRLPVTVIAASAADGRPGAPRRPDPIVIPAGGPGFDIAGVYGWTGAPHNDDRDVILYDQRGTGLAEPSLDCAERDATWLANLQQTTTYEQESRAVIDTMAACRERIAADGVDFDDYDTEASVLDLDAIRRALGHEEWNILGISYGARLALAAMRSTPAGIRSVILDSVSDVTSGGTASTIASADRAIGVLVEACAQDPACAEAFGDLGIMIDDLYARWEAEPVTVDVDLGDGGGTRTFAVTGSDLLAGLFDAMYEARLIPLLPSIVADFTAGRTDLLAELVRSGVGQGSGAADAMQWSVDCADAGRVDPVADAAVQADPGRHGTLVSTLPYCSEWDVEPTSPNFNAPVRSDIPTLVVAGRFDPVTPPEGSEAAADELTNATFLLFPDAAHTVTRFGATCVDEIELAFLDDPSAPLDASCIDDIPPVDFVVPTD